MGKNQTGPILGSRSAAYKYWIPRRVLKPLANLLLVGLVVGSFLPSQEKALLGTQQSGAVHNDYVDLRHRLYHFGSFGLTTLAFLLLARGIQEETQSAAGMFAVGCLIEVTQCLMIPNHLLEWWDIRDDFYAIGGVFLLVQAANKLWPIHGAVKQ